VKFRSSSDVPKNAVASVRARSATETAPRSTRRAVESRTTWKAFGSARPSACFASSGLPHRTPSRTNETTRTTAAETKK
jgi:hypothetical protein